MEIKLFGKSLFSTRSKGEMLFEMPSPSSPKAQQSKYLPDFYERRGGSSIMDSYVIQEFSNGSAVATPINKTKGKKITKAPVKKVITPKGVYDLKLLHDKVFKLNTTPEYIEKQLGDFKNKLNLINSEEYDMRNGVDEITSVIMRFENRKKYAENKETFEQFPYTTSSKIAEVVKKHDNLQLGKIAQFIADLPKEATDMMKIYEDATVKVCAKKPVFYIIADKKDFKKSDTRRDPILLAQSPFGHVWQILGAWDKEMMFLEEL